ncbi:MAG: hypothetical protein OEW24_09845 [Chloroflexota bacterium]|nr:hypothetical protein [Chloroflexota bacterium]
MNASQESLALTVGDQQQIVPMTFSDRGAEERFRAALNDNARKALSVRITPAPESDVQGHEFDASLKSVWLKVQLDDDDTEGHAISVRFPTAQDADNFRRNLLAAGVLVGAMIVGSAGAMAIGNNPAAPGVSAPVQRPAINQPVNGTGIGDLAAGSSASAASASIATGINPATGKPWRSGFQEGVDFQAGAAGAAAAAATGIDPVTGKPWQSGFQEGADAASAGAADAGLSGSSSVERPAGSGPLEGAE